jgi:hypothetical protein
MESTSLPSLADISSDRLTARLYELRVEERQRLVEFLAYLAELERRRLHLDLGFTSTFAFCTDHLGLTKAAAYRRTTAARLLGRFPVVATYLADGRLNLTTLVELREVLCEEKLGEILDRAAGRSEEDVKMLVAALRPQPEPPDLLHRLPAPSASSGPVLTAPDVTEPTIPAPAALALSPPPPPPPLPPVRVAPIAEDRYVVRASVGKEFVEDLKTVRALLSHQIPDGDLALVLHECLRIAAGVLTKRRKGAGKPAPAPTEPSRAQARTRHIPASVRDEVWRRDEGRCAFVAETGRRCNSRWQVEFHHRIPFARGGPSTVDGLELRCRRHNQRAAELDYGYQASVARPARVP